MVTMRVVKKTQKVFDSLTAHSDPGKIGSMLHELLRAAGYGEKEILDAATALANIAHAGIHDES